MKADIFNSADTNCARAPIKRDTRFESFNKCRPGGESDDKGSYFITSALGNFATNAVFATFAGLTLEVYTDSSCQKC